jgi:hypothetical protein
VSRRDGQYLEIVKELAKCRDDDSLHLAQQKLQDFLNRNLVGGSSAETGFCKRYINGDASLHVHGFLSIEPSIGNRIEFCAVLNSANACIGASGSFDPFFAGESRFGEIEVSVLVDVREISEQPEHIAGPIISVIRLHGLDECKRLFGNPRKDVRETVVGRGFLGDLEPQREETVLFPIGGELDVSGVKLDKIERQVIDGRSQLIQDLSRQDGDFRRGCSAHAYLLFAVRLRGSFVRVTSSVVWRRGFLVSYGFDMFRHPSEFEVGGVDTGEHAP